MTRQIGVNVVASGFLQLLLSQLSTRIISFLLNLTIARHLSPEAYGLSAVQFHLITTTILMLSREGLRRGCLRFRPDSKQDSSVDARSVLSVAWLALPAGLVVTAAVIGCVLFTPHASSDGDYRTAVLLHGVAALLELAAEPLYILALVNLRFTLRAQVDTLSLLVKSGLTLLLVTKTRLAPALVFSIAQISSSAVILLAYAAATGRSAIRSLRTRSPAEAPAGSKQQQQQQRAAGAMWGPREREVLRMSGLFTLQAMEKQLLAEGSKIVLVAVQSQYNQGVYGLVANLGSLVVRTLLQPLEEIAFAAFSRFQVLINESRTTDQAAATAAAAAHVPSSSSSSNKKAGSAPLVPAPGDDGTGDKQDPGAASMQQLAQVLSVLVKAVSLLGLVSASFGPAYAYTLIRLVYSAKWSETEAPAVLACYAVYILLLAVNGVTEAFVHAVLDGKGLQQINALLIVFSVAHVAASIVSIQLLGAVGLVLADAINMALRIACSSWYIHRQFLSLPSFSLAQLLPQSSTLLLLLAASAVCRTSQTVFLADVQAQAGSSTTSFLKCAAGHIAVGLLCLGCVGVALVRFERKLLQDVRATISGSRGEGHKEQGHSKEE